MIRVIVFDFDGVLVNSNRLKYDAWFEVFPESEGFSRPLIEQTLREIPETRFEIARVVLSRTQAAGANLEALVAAAAGRYNDIVQKGIASDALIPGAAEALARLASDYALFINSSTPEEALRESVERLGMSRFFRGVYGRPRSKTENLKRIMAETDAGPREIVMVGDGDPDREAAEAIGCRFVGIANDWNGWREREFPLIAHINQLLELLPQL